MRQTEDRLLARCARRLIPLMVLLYLVNYIDRVDTGFAALTMNRDLGFSPSVFGFGGAVFFAGYLLFQIPSSLLLERRGARMTICWIMIAWGAISAGNAFVHSAVSFYVLRFLLGIAEAGFFPGMVFYLTLWFPQSERARFTALFATAIPLSGIVGGPLSSLVLQMDGVLGLHGWQWLFLVEGLPACLLGVLVLRLLPDGPAQARWLTNAEKEIIAGRLVGQSGVTQSDWLGAMRDVRVVAIALAGVGRGAALYGATLWLPQMIQALGFSIFLVGIIAAVPYLASAVAMILWGYSSDRSGDRIWHVALPTLLAAGGFAGAGILHGAVGIVACLTLAMVGLLAATSPHFVLASSFLRGPAAATSIALLNAATSVGGFAGPMIVGVLRQQSGDYGSAMTVLALGLFLAALIILALRRMVVSPLVTEPKQQGA